MIRIFIPAYNEEKFIEPNLRYMLSTFSKLIKEDYIIYVVNDGSTDKTGEIVDSIKDKNLVQLRCKGPTVRENLARMFFKHGQNDDLIFFMDADLSTDMGAIPYLIEEAKRGFDVVIGSRYVEDSKIRRTIFRFIISKLFNFTLKIYFCSNVKDHFCGFKLFKAEVIKDLINDMGFNLQRRTFWDAEMLFRAQQKNYKIKEIPVSWVEGPKSYISLKKERSMIPYLLLLKFKLLQKKRKRDTK